MMENESAASAEQICQKFSSLDVPLEEGILTGGGGGFMWTFTDFVVSNQGQARLNHYLLNSDTGTQIDFQSAPLLLNNRADEYEALIQQAVEIDFFHLKVPAPRSTLVRHTCVAHPKHGKRRIVWSLEGDPNLPKALVEFDLAIRKFLTDSFTDEFGG